jgi:hypothetical protein
VIPDADDADEDEDEDEYECISCNNLQPVHMKIPCVRVPTGLIVQETLRFPQAVTAWCWCLASCMVPSGFITSKRKAFWKKAGSVKPFSDHGISTGCKWGC